MKKTIFQYCSTGRKGVKPFFFSRSSVGDPWSGVIFLHLKSSLNDYWIKTLHNLTVKDQIPKTFGSNFSLNLFTISSLMTIEANIIELNQVPKTLNLNSLRIHFKSNSLHLKQTTFFRDQVQTTLDLKLNQREKWNNFFLKRNSEIILFLNYR